MFVKLCLDITVIMIKPLCNIILLRLKTIAAILLFLYVVTEEIYFVGLVTAKK
jgi:hypothetical protein